MELFRDHPVKMAGAIVTICAGALWGGAFFWDAKSIHAQTQDNQRTIEQLVEFQRGVVAEKEADIKAKRQVEQALRELCLSGKLKDKAECAKVGVRLD